MIAPPPGVRVLVWSQPVDFRRGMDSLAALVQVTLRQDPFAGDVYVFRSRRRDRVKCLMYDGTGLLLISKRLERGGFLWPPVSDGIVRLPRFSSRFCSPVCPGTACGCARSTVQRPPAEQKVVVPSGLFQ